MSIWTCRACTARYAVDAPGCPQCGSTEYVDGDAVADPDLLAMVPEPAEDSPPQAKAKAATKPTA